jgi:hypothetical protein
MTTSTRNAEVLDDRMKTIIDVGMNMTRIMTSLVMDIVEASHGGNLIKGGW